MGKERVQEPKVVENSKETFSSEHSKFELGGNSMHKVCASLSQSKFRHGGELGKKFHPRQGAMGNSQLLGVEGEIRTSSLLIQPLISQLPIFPRNTAYSRSFGQTSLDGKKRQLSGKGRGGVVDLGKSWGRKVNVIKTCEILKKLIKYFKNESF